MATVTNLSANNTVATNVQIVGTFGPFSMVIATPTAAEAAADSLTVTFPNLNVINFAMVQAFSTASLCKTSDVKVTYTGNVLTIAAGSTYTDILATDTFTCLVGGV
jgi:hypothetical protein